MKRIIMLLTVALDMVAMPMPALAAPQNPKNKSRNSCGAAGGFAVPPGQTSPELGTCGFQNNPHYPNLPPGF